MKLYPSGLLLAFLATIAFLGISAGQDPVRTSASVAPRPQMAEVERLTADLLRQAASAGATDPIPASPTLVEAARVRQEADLLP